MQPSDTRYLKMTLRRNLHSLNRHIRPLFADSAAPLLYEAAATGIKLDLRPYGAIRVRFKRLADNKKTRW